MPKFGLTFKGLDEYIDKLDKLGGTEAVKRGVEAGLKEAKNTVNTRIAPKIANSNLPAGGKYGSAPHVRDAIDKDMSVEWSGLTGEIHVGFNLNDDGGFTSIFLMYGTPRHDPAKGLKASIYGSATQRAVVKAEAEAINKVIDRIMGGN